MNVTGRLKTDLDYKLLKSWQWSVELLQKKYQLPDLFKPTSVQGVRFLVSHDKFKGTNTTNPSQTNSDSERQASFTSTLRPADRDNNDEQENVQNLSIWFKELETYDYIYV